MHEQPRGRDQPVLPVVDLRTARRASVRAGRGHRRGDRLLRLRARPAGGRVRGRLGRHLPDCTGVGVASGTAALHRALRAVGAGPGEVVVTTPFTSAAAAKAIGHAGADVRLVDVEDIAGGPQGGRGRAGRDPLSRICASGSRLSPNRFLRIALAVVSWPTRPAACPH